jgi:hypothetical protein
MPLGGTGAIMGSAMAAAVGSTAPASGAMFAVLGDTIAAWALTNIEVNPGAMAVSSGAVAGIGSFSVTGSAAELGAALAAAMTIPASATDSIAVWVAVAGALISHFENFGQANGAGLTQGAVLGGQGTLLWASPVFVPPLATVMTPPVTDPVAALALEAFGAALLLHIQTNAAIVAVSLSGAPLSGPADGPVTGTGSII